MRTLEQALKDRAAEREREAIEASQREHLRRCEIALHEKVVERIWTIRLSAKYDIDPNDLNVEALFSEDEQVFWIRVQHGNGYAQYLRPPVYFQDTGELEICQHDDGTPYPDAWRACINNLGGVSSYDENLLDALSRLAYTQDNPPF